MRSPSIWTSTSTSFDFRKKSAQMRSLSVGSPLLNVSFFWARTTASSGFKAKNRDLSCRGESVLAKLEPKLNRYGRP